MADLFGYVKKVCRQLVKDHQSQLQRRERMLGAMLVCAAGESRYRAPENGQRPFSAAY